MNKVLLSWRAPSRRGVGHETRPHGRSRAALARAAALAGLAAGGAVGGAAHEARAAIPAYTLVGSFALPADAWDVLPDGRVVRIVGDALSVQSGPNTSTYEPLGSIPPGLVGSFGASFLRASPSGGLLAIGDNRFSFSGPVTQRVLLVNAGELNTAGPAPVRTVDAPNSDAAWRDDDTLYVSGVGASSLLTRIDVPGAAGEPISATTVVTDIGQFSGGVAISGPRLFTGVGADFALPITGEIRSFELSALDAASASAAFSTGAFQTRALSAASLGFDAAGNLLVGGGDFASGGERGFALVIDLSTGARLALAPAGEQFYGVRFNPATQELLVTAGGTAYRYAVPGPSAAGLLALGGLLAARRRRS